MNSKHPYASSSSTSATNPSQRSPLRQSTIVGGDSNGSGNVINSSNTRQIHSNPSQPGNNYNNTYNGKLDRDSIPIN